MRKRVVVSILVSIVIVILSLPFYVKAQVYPERDYSQVNFKKLIKMIKKIDADLERLNSEFVQRQDRIEIKLNQILSNQEGMKKEIEKIKTRVGR
jgi:peptidoglycan hydrolase CwlO-like protein